MLWKGLLKLSFFRYALALHVHLLSKRTLYNQIVADMWTASCSTLGLSQKVA